MSMQSAYDGPTLRLRCWVGREFEKEIEFSEELDAEYVKRMVLREARRHDRIEIFSSERL